MRAFSTPSPGGIRVGLKERSIIHAGSLVSAGVGAGRSPAYPGSTGPEGGSGSRSGTESLSEKPWLSK